jgi:hypothetical protein
VTAPVPAPPLVVSARLKPDATLYVAEVEAMIKVGWGPKKVTRVGDDDLDK